MSSHTNIYRVCHRPDGNWGLERQRTDGTWHLLPMLYPTRAAAQKDIAARLAHFAEMEQQFRKAEKG